jgi:hypothetical protein
VTPLYGGNSKVYTYYMNISVKFWYFQFLFYIDLFDNDPSRLKYVGDTIKYLRYPNLSVYTWFASMTDKKYITEAQHYKMYQKYGRASVSRMQTSTTAITWDEVSSTE